LLAFFSSVFFHVMISPSPLSRLFWTNKVWNYGYEAYFLSERMDMIKEAMKKYVPENSRISISTQNTLNWGYLAQRRYYFPYPLGVVEPALVFSLKDFRFWSIMTGSQKEDLETESLVATYQPVFAEYVLIDFKRPWYVADQGCNWQVDKPLYLSRTELERFGIDKDLSLKWAGCAEKIKVNWKGPSGRIYHGNLKTVFLSLLEETFKMYKVVYENDGFMILKKR